MAINRISGRILQDDLQRDSDLSIQGNLIYFDIGNSKIGVNTSTPADDVEIVGNVLVGNTTVTAAGLSSSSDIIISPSGNINVSGVNITNLSDPIEDSDAVTKQFLDNAVSGFTFDVSDSSNTSTIESGDTITIQGTDSEIQSTLSEGVFTIGLPDDVTVSGNLSVNDTLTVAGIIIGNDISGGGNLVIPGQITANTIVANSAATLSYANDNAVVFSNSEKTLVTYPDIRYSGTGALTIDNVDVNIANITISGSEIRSSENLNVSASSGNSVVVANLQISDNTTPNSVYFADSEGHVSTNNNILFDGTTLTVAGSVNSTQSVAGNVTIDGNLISSDENLEISAAANSFVSVNNTTAIVVPVGTTSERPSVAEAGMVRWNSDVNYLEVYDGTEWESLGTDVTFITSQVIDGDDSTTVFTLDQEATTAGILVYINGVAQVPGVSYTVATDQITFVEAPQSQDTVEIRFISLSQTVSALTDESGETAIRVTASDQIEFTVEGEQVGNISNNAVTFSSNTPVSVGSHQLGFLDKPQRIVTGNTSLLNSDRGGHLYINSSGTFEISIPADSTLSLPIGTHISVISHTTSDVDIIPAAGVDLYLAGNATSDTRTIASYGHAELLKVADDTWSIFGISIS